MTQGDAFEWKMKTIEDGDREGDGGSMPVLVKCIECGGDVSSGAAECPHCHRYPRPVTCTFCRKPLRGSQAIGMMHPACWEAQQASKDLDKFYCTVCRSELSYRNFEFALVQSMDFSSPASSSPCPKCGHPFDVEKCDYCGGGLIKGTGETVHRRSQPPLHVHRFCTRFVQNRVEPAASKASCLVAVIASAALPLPLIFLIRVMV